MFVEPLGRNLVQLCQIPIQHDFLPADQQNRLFDPLAGNELGFGHASTFLSRNTAQHGHAPFKGAGTPEGGGGSAAVAAGGGAAGGRVSYGRGQGTGGKCGSDRMRKRSETSDCPRLAPVVQYGELVLDRHTGRVQLSNGAHDAFGRQVARGVVVLAGDEEARIMSRVKLCKSKKSSWFLVTDSPIRNRTR